jgi:hypothetical protein
MRKAPVFCRGFSLMDIIDTDTMIQFVAVRPATRSRADDYGMESPPSTRVPQSAGRWPHPPSSHKLTATFLLSWQCAVSNPAQKSRLQPPGFPPRGLFFGLVAGAAGGPRRAVCEPIAALSSRGPRLCVFLRPALVDALAGRAHQAGFLHRDDLAGFTDFVTLNSPGDEPCGLPNS